MARVERCEGCPYGGRAVGGRGPTGAAVLIVGQAPGIDEMHTGQPFTGPSGQLLAGAMREAGLDINDARLCNAVRCRPSEGDQPSREAIEACRPFLLDELPGHRLIIALGNAAIRSITHDHTLKITHCRGLVFQSEIGLVLPAIHPAAILRQSSDYNQLVSDLRYASDLLCGEVARDPGEIEYAYLTDPDEIMEVNRVLMKHPEIVVAGDVETAGPNKGLNPRTDTILCLGVCWAPGKVVIIPGELAHLLRGSIESGPQWIWHNGKFDTSFLRNAGIDARVDEDTELLHYSMVEAKGTHGLKQLARDYLGAPEYRDSLRVYLKGNKSYGAIPKPALHWYLARDCHYTLQLWTRLIDSADEWSLKLYREILLPASRTMQLVEDNGLLIDAEALNAIRDERRAVMAEQLRIMQNLVAEARGSNKPIKIRRLKASFTPAEFNPASHMQAQAVIYGIMRDANGQRLMPDPVPRKFKFDTREATLNAIPKHPFIDALLAWRGAQKIVSTYCNGFERCIESDGRVHTSYLLHGTVTGRPSSTRPNVLNMPRDKSIRRMIVAPAGKVLVECDFSQAELRMLALLSGDPWMVGVYQRGEDLHAETAYAIYGDRTPEHRQLCKSLNFALLYGAGAPHLRDVFEITLEAAEEIMQRWRDNAPKAWQFLEWARAHVDQRKPLLTPFGRRRHWGWVDDRNRYTLMNEASNFPIQSTASDLVMIAAIRLHDWLVSHGVKLVNVIYDSLLMEVDAVADAIALVSQYVSAAMERVPRDLLGDKVRFVVDCKVGNRWGELQAYACSNDGS